MKGNDKLSSFFDGLVVKIGSETGLSNFEGILKELDSEKDAIMIDQSNLALELTNGDKLKMATTHFVEKSAFASVTSIVGGVPQQAIIDGADAIILDSKIWEPAAISYFSDRVIESEEKITYRVIQNDPRPLSEMLEAKSEFPDMDAIRGVFFKKQENSVTDSPDFVI